MKKVIRLLLALVMALSLLPTAVWAEGEDAAAPAEALHLTTLLRQSGCTGPILTVCHEPVTGAHVGPGMLAMYFYSPTWR